MGREFSVWPKRVYWGLKTEERVKPTMFLGVLELYDKRKKILNIDMTI
jgi:hypothetical protein